MVPLCSRGGGNAFVIISSSGWVLVPLGLRGGGNVVLWIDDAHVVLVPLSLRGGGSTCGHGADTRPGIHT